MKQTLFQFSVIQLSSETEKRDRSNALEMEWCPSNKAREKPCNLLSQNVTYMLSLLPTTSMVFVPTKYMPFHLKFPGVMLCFVTCQLFSSTTGYCDQCHYLAIIISAFKAWLHSSYLFIIMCSLHKVHERNAYRAGRLSTRFRTTRWIWIRLGMDGMPWDLP